MADKGSGVTPITPKKFDPKALAKYSVSNLKREGYYSITKVENGITAFAKRHTILLDSFIYGLAVFFLFNGYSAAIILNDNPIACMNSATGDFIELGSTLFFNYICSELGTPISDLVLRRIASVPSIRTQMVIAFADLELTGPDREKAERFLNIILGGKGYNLTKNRHGGRDTLDDENHSQSGSEIVI